MLVAVSADVSKHNSKPMLNPYQYTWIDVINEVFIYPTIPPWKGYDTRSILKVSITGLNSKLSFS